MKHFVKILIFCFTIGKADNPFLSDVAFHYKSGVNISAFSSASATLFQYAFCKEIKLSVSVGVGISNAIIASNLKEDIHDGLMKRGTKSNPDRFTTYWGGGVGTLTYIPFHNYYFKRKYNLENFQHLAPYGIN